MRVLLTTFGSSGDINPVVAIGRALDARGHDVTMLADPYFRSAVEGAGLRYRPLLGHEAGPHAFATTRLSSNPVFGGFAVTRGVILPRAEEIYTRTRAAIESFRPDVLVTHHICIGAKWAAEATGTPYATVAISPMVWFNPRDPSVYSPFGPRTPGEGLMRTNLFFGKIALRATVDRPFNRVRRRLGLPPARDMFTDDPRSGIVSLAVWSAAYRSPLAGDPPQGRICGFTWHDRFAGVESPPRNVDAFLDECDRAGEPPVVFTLGTAVCHAAGRFYAHAAEACRRLGRRGLLLTYRAEFMPDDLPSGVFAARYAPYSAVFPRAAAIVHHGGIGTNALALRAGKPALATPVAYDQFDGAARAERLGVAVMTPHLRMSARRLTEGLRRVLDDRRLAERAEAIGAKVRAEDGAATAAEELERTLGATPAG